MKTRVRMVVAAMLPLLLGVGTCRASSLPVYLQLGPAQAGGVPSKHGRGHTGGGNFNVSQPAPNTLVITLTGVAAAGGCPLVDSMARFESELSQEFTVVFASPAVRAASLSVQGRVIGLLRSPCKGTAELVQATAIVTCPGKHEETVAATLALPPSGVAYKEQRSVYLRGAPLCLPILPGCYRLRQTFAIAASQPKGCLPCHPATAEFAPDPALDPSWISHKDPFRGAVKKEFGFQVIVKVIPTLAP